MIIIDKKEYDGESLVEIEFDIWDACNKNDLRIPSNMHGFLTGTFKVTIEWTNE